MTPFIALLGVGLAQEPPSVEQYLEDHEVFAFTDGSSVYTFHQDHRFRLDPVGLSGRTVEGRWETADRGLSITGQWGWQNGISPLDDVREMTLFVNPLPGPTTQVGPAKIEVHPVYFTVDRLKKATVKAAQPK